MKTKKISTPSIVVLLAATLVLSGCSRLGLGLRNPDASQSAANDDSTADPINDAQPTENIFSLFNPPEVELQVQVNRYLWAASLQVLDFLPIQTVDPFTGVIVTGFGAPPGGGRAYRATVLIDDPALDARSLKVSMQTRGGAVSDSTVRAIEDAILTRARQLRVGDSRL